jgi:hypothetical protein
LNRFRILETELAICDAFSTAVFALSEAPVSALAIAEVALEAVSSAF